ncbi:hypothetical protein Hdeb2414_s0586g00920041 [Helianthus debilis subsp. tardiflorus]
MKELLFPVGNRLTKLYCWEEPIKSFMFCLVSTYAIYRGCRSYVVGLVLAFIALFIVITRWFSRGREVDEFTTTDEHNGAAFSHPERAEELIQDGNILLLKLRGLFTLVHFSTGPLFLLLL